jgi:hypothetical protein
LPRGTTGKSGNADVEAAPGSPKPASYSEAGSPPIVTIYGKARLFHSPIRVERRVSHSEDDEPINESSEKMNSNPPTHLRYGGVSPLEEVSRPVLIRQGSAFGKRSISDDTMDTSHNDSKRVKTDGGGSNDMAVAHFEAAVEEAAVAMAGMRKKSVISPSSLGENLDSQQKQGGYKPSMQSYTEGSSQYYHPLQRTQSSYLFPPYSHPSYGYTLAGGHPMYHVYPPHPHPDYYAQYAVPPSPAMQAYRPPPPYTPALNHPTKKVHKKSMICSRSNAQVVPSDPGIHDTKNGDASFPLDVSDWQPAACSPASSNRCVPLKDPVPFKAWT